MMHIHRLKLLVFMLLALLVTGCEPDIRVIHNTWDDFPSDPKPRQRESRGTYSDLAGGQGWAIQLAQIEGNDRHRQAQIMVQKLRRDTSVADLWMEDMNNVVSIYQGRFTEATDPAIRPTLAKLQSIKVDGEKPFAECQLVPLIGQGRVIADPFDLRQFIGYYSLQIGFYDADFDGDFRAAAEQAVRVLREDGVEAYYYHGPYRSILAVGVFSYEQAFVSAGTHDTYAPRIHLLQEKFPFNLGNGVTLRQKAGGRDLGEQKSSLIRVF